jgi:hypothetical protein
MIYSNEDLVGIKDDVLGTLELAISELEGVDEYKSILDQLEDLKTDLENEAEVYEEAYAEEERKQLEDLNNDYERSV